jgi:spore germination protein GerM
MVDDTQRTRAVWTAAAAAVTVLIAAAVLAACGGGGGASPSETVTVTTTPSGVASPSGSPSVPPSPTPGPTMTVTAYFLRGGTTVYLADHQAQVAALHVAAPKSTMVATASVNAVLAGPDAKARAIGFRTAIPQGTALHGVTISGGVATVDLSGSFAGTSGALATRQSVAQVVYTLTQFSTVSKGVLFKLDGKPLATLNGVDLSQPQTRADYEGVTPAILVETPTAFDTVPVPAAGADALRTLRVKGTANVFEATFWISLVDAQGKTLFKHVEQATSGSGTRGTFSVTLSFATPAAAGTLSVWDVSMKDGSFQNKVSIPLTFAR